MNKWKSIADNLFDIMVIGGKLLISYIRDGVNILSNVWKDDHLTAPRNDDDGVWQGGVTNLKGSRIDDDAIGEVDDDDNTKTPKNIIYDGTLDIDWEGDRFE